MSEKTFPYTAWVLPPSYKPRCVEFVAAFAFIGTVLHRTSEGKDYRLRDIHASLNTAIAEGNKRIDEQEARLDKQLVTLNKRRAALKVAK